MLWRPPRRSWCMHRILCTACNRNSTRSFERGHDGNILEEAYRGRYARQRLLNFWPESSCGYHAIKRFVCIIQVARYFPKEVVAACPNDKVFGLQLTLPNPNELLEQLRQISFLQMIYCLAIHGLADAVSFMNDCAENSVVMDHIATWNVVHAMRDLEALFQSLEE